MQGQEFGLIDTACAERAVSCRERPCLREPPASRVLFSLNVFNRAAPGNPYTYLQKYIKMGK